MRGRWRTGAVPGARTWHPPPAAGLPENSCRIRLPAAGERLRRSSPVELWNSRAGSSARCKAILKVGRMLLADPQIQRPFFEPRVAPATQVVAAIDPLVTIGVLLLCAALFRVRFGGAYVILALVVFSLTFPGGAPHTSSAGALARDVLTGWSTTVALLLLIGLATSTPETFGPRGGPPLAVCPAPRPLA